MARILVIDDDPVIVEMITHTLEESGHTVVAAADGRVALKLWRINPVDIVLTDIFMPDKDGLEFIRELKQDCPDAKIIAMSGGGSSKMGLDLLDVAMRFGVSQTLKKPFALQTLLETIRITLEPASHERCVVSDVPTSSARPLVLVVDDDAGVRMTLRLSLDQTDIAVVEAESGRRAVSIFKEVHPDLVLLDVTMPGMDGFAVCAELRALPGGQHIPVLIMTGRDDHASITKAYAVGATDFMAKPINGLILAHRVGYMLRASQVLQKLVISEARLAHAQNIAQMGSWEWDLMKNTVHLSKEIGRLFGRSPDEFQGTCDEFTRSIHPEIRAVIQQGVNESLTEKRQSTFDHRLTLSNGRERVLHAHAEAIADPNTPGICISGTIQNITEENP